MGLAIAAALVFASGSVPNTLWTFPECAAASPHCAVSVTPCWRCPAGSAELVPICKGWESSCHRPRAGRFCRWVSDRCRQAATLLREFGRCFWRINPRWRQCWSRRPWSRPKRFARGLLTKTTRAGCAGLEDRSGDYDCKSAPWPERGRSAAGGFRALFQRALRGALGWGNGPQRR